jgi:hypothetical protein
MRRTAFVAILAAYLTTSTASPTGTAIAEPLTPKQYAKSRSVALWSLPEWRCLEDLWHRESRWDEKADNPRSTAYGIPQILGLDERLTASQQIDAGLRYIVHRYDTPCRALAFHKRKGYY